MVRDGVSPYYIHHLPGNMSKAGAPPKDKKTQVFRKFDKEITCDYLTLVDPATAKHFIDSFHISKGNKDIGLTRVVFAPNYWLPYSPTITRLLHF